MTTIASPESVFETEFAASAAGGSVDLRAENSASSAPLAKALRRWGSASSRVAVELSTGRPWQDDLQIWRRGSVGAFAILAALFWAQGSIWLRPEGLPPLICGLLLARVWTRWREHVALALTVPREGDDRPVSRLAAQVDSGALVQSRDLIICGLLATALVVFFYAIVVEPVWQPGSASWLLGAAAWLAASGLLAVDLSVRGRPALLSRAWDVWTVAGLVIVSLAMWRLPFSPETRLLLWSQALTEQLSGTLIDLLRVWNVTEGGAVRTAAGVVHLDRAAFAAASLGTVMLLTAGWTTMRRRSLAATAFVMSAGWIWTIQVAAVQGALLVWLLNTRLSFVAAQPWCDGLFGALSLMLTLLLTLSTDQWLADEVESRSKRSGRSLRRSGRATGEPFGTSVAVGWLLVRPMTRRLLTSVLLIFAVAVPVLFWRWQWSAVSVARRFDPRALALNTLPERIGPWRRQNFAGGQRAGLVRRDWPVERWTYRDGPRELIVSTTAPRAWTCWTNLAHDGWSVTTSRWIRHRSGGVAALEQRGEQPAWQRSTLLVRGFVGLDGELRTSWREHVEAALAGPETSPAYDDDTWACVEVQIVSPMAVQDDDLRVARELLAITGSAITHAALKVTER